MLLTILTRTFKRPELLKRNQESLAIQTCKEFEQVVIDDKVGIGVDAANALFKKQSVEGDYVWVFDDDNYISSPKFIESVKQLIEPQDFVVGAGLESKPIETGKEKPDVIICSADVLGSVLPDKTPFKLGHIDAINIIVSKKVWMKHRKDWAEADSGDFDFINSVMQGNYKIEYIKDVMLAYDRRSQGAKEEKFDVGKLKIESSDYYLAKCKIGGKVIVNTCLAGEFYFIEDQIVVVDEKNHDFVESNLRAGLIEEYPRKSKVILEKKTKKSKTE